MRQNAEHTVTLVFCFVSLIKSKPLSPLLDAFVIISSLNLTYTAGFSLRLKCGSLDTDV